MFHATIHADDGSPLHLTGDVVPYDLEVLRQHVLARAARGGATRVEVRLAAGRRPAIERALRDLARRGIELVFPA